MRLRFWNCMPVSELCSDIIFRFTSSSRAERGIACTSGMILAVCPLAAPVCLILFIGSIAITRYVSLGSILVVTSYLVQVLIFGHMGYLHIDAAYLPEFYVVSACFTAMALWRHRSNIGRLLHGTENKFTFKKNKQEGK